MNFEHMNGADMIATTAQDGRASSPLFERYQPGDVRALIEQFPLAWVCAGDAGAIEASRLPLIGKYDGEGVLTELIGHLSRLNPLYAELSEKPGATILFNGPDAYVSPEHAGLRDWAPTWNYAQVKVAAEIAFDDSLTRSSLSVLIDAMENGRKRPWNAEELGMRFEGMLTRIIGFRAKVTSVSGKFKLGQDERPEALAAILGTLPDHATADWMRRFNHGR